MFILVGRINKESPYSAPGDLLNAMMPELKDLTGISISEDIEKSICSQKECAEIKKGLKVTTVKTLESYISCICDELKEAFPMLPGESLLAYTASFFKTGYGATPENTAVIRRDTNFSTIYFVLFDVIWDKDKLKFIVPEKIIDFDKLAEIALQDSSKLPQAERVQGSSRSGLRSFLRGLSAAIVEDLSGQVGLFAFNTIFGSAQVSDPFGDLYREITSIVRREIAANTIQNMEGIINGVTRFVIVNHNTRKRHGPAVGQSIRVFNEDLSTRLTVHFNQLYGVIGRLEVADIAMESFGTYMLCAYQYIMIAYELARLNPRPKIYHDIVKNHAEKFKVHAERTIPRIAQERMNRFVVEKHSGTFRPDPRVAPVRLNYYLWHDTHTGRRSTTPFWQFQTPGKGKQCEFEIRFRAFVMAPAQRAAADAMRNELLFNEFLNTLELAITTTPPSVEPEPEPKPEPFPVPPMIPDYGFEVGVTLQYGDPKPTGTNGTMVTYDGERIYFIMEGKTCFIANEASFDAVFRFNARSHVNRITQDEFDAYEQGEIIENPALIRHHGSIKVYFIPRVKDPLSKRHWVISAKTFDYCRFNWSRVIDIPSRS